MDNATRQIISILVNNQPGVLSRIAGLFSRRGYNIDGLTVCATEDDRWSRMTITVYAAQNTVKQIVAQLEKQEDVVRVMDFDVKNVAARELLLIKVADGGARPRGKAGPCTLLRAHETGGSAGSQLLEMTRPTHKVDNFVKVLSAYDIIEMARTGGAALERGSDSLSGTIRL